jgi:ATP-dependent DNA helicase RecG
VEALPFQFTEAQKRVLSEAVSDLERGTPPMSRLLQGDVGSGKTVLALAALLIAATAGYQGAMMAPTEILAEQHFLTVSKLLKPFIEPSEDGVILVHIDPAQKPIKIGLLLGRMSKKEKEEAQRKAREGELDILIGTHALIQESVDMPRLVLSVVDEQHRFGVIQRAALRERGEARPHVLVMSATPIPRTLALTLYGDLDISVLDELPPSRQKITTRWVKPDKRAPAYGFLRKQVQKGRQAFVVCPLIDESEVIEAKAATEEYRRLSQEVFPDLRLGLIHGRMSSSEKDDAMSRFRDGEMDILVSTPVVEVGIDVPNATVMLIEAADRFGLAQLHQFRGRVGRGKHASYCLLLAEDPTPEARERLRILEETQDGFKLAEEDLRLRGPGDFFGTRQSGLPTLKVAGLGDRDLFLQARQEAEDLLKKDPSLSAPEHQPLSKEMSRFLSAVAEESS